MYEFELRRNDDNEVVYSGKESNTKISFNDLEPAMEYVFRVRLFITDYRTGIRFSSWSSPTLGMMTSLTTAMKTPPTTGMDHFELISMLIAYSEKGNRKSQVFSFLITVTLYIYNLVWGR